jgi:hypothetical protein
MTTCLGAQSKPEKFSGQFARKQANKSRFQETLARAFADYFRHLQRDEICICAIVSESCVAGSRNYFLYADLSLPIPAHLIISG